MERYNFTNPLFLFKIESMKSRFYFLFCLVFLVACDDGDIFTVELDFDENLEICDDFVTSYLIYDTKTDPNESLTLVLPKPTYKDLFLLPTIVGEPVTIDMSLTGVQFNYRTYNIDPADLLCDVITNSVLIIKEDYPANDGIITVTSTIVDDDNDGVPNEFEGIAGEQYEDGIYWDSLDTDIDGIPDYLDEDDDNDNVLTINEIDNTDGDDDPTTNSLNTDVDFPNGDDVPDYLDDDDDGDGIKTYLEDTNEDKNPRSASDIVFDEAGESIYRYLYNHPNAMQAYPDSGKIITNYKRIVTTNFVITGVDLDILRTTIINFGTLITTLEITPEIFEDVQD